MASILKVDKLDPQSGTALELGTSGDTITVPTGAGLTVTDEVKTNKVSPATGTAFSLGDSGDTFTVPSGATLDISASTLTPPATMPASSGINFTALNATNLGSGTVPTARLGTGTASSSTVLYGDQTYKAEPTGILRPNVEPIIINGDMNVAQRQVSVASISSGNGWRTVDRFRDWTATAGTWTSTQETLTSGDAYEDGFIQALKWDCTTANASLSAGSYLIWSTSLEAQNCALFKKGTSEAEIMTLAFWVKATKTGTNTVGIYDSVNNRAIRIAYTIDSTDTWEKKVMTFAGDTSGALGTGPTKAIEVTWYWVAGSNRTSGTLQTTWGTDVTADSAVGQVNHADSTSNNIHMTGVQLEVGSYTADTLPSFQHEGAETSLGRCMRYYENNYKNDEYPGDSGITDPGSFAGFLYSTDFLSSIYGFKVRKRVNPTMTFYDRNGTAAKWYAGVYQVSEAIEDVVSSINQPQGFAATCSGVVANTNESHGFWTADSEM